MYRAGPNYRPGPPPPPPSCYRPDPECAGSTLTVLSRPPPCYRTLPLDILPLAISCCCWGTIIPREGGGSVTSQTREESASLGRRIRPRLYRCRVSGAFTHVYILHSSEDVWKKKTRRFGFDGRPQLCTTSVVCSR